MRKISRKDPKHREVVQKAIEFETVKLLQLINELIKSQTAYLLNSGETPDKFFHTESEGSSSDDDQ